MVTFKAVESLSEFIDAIRLRGEIFVKEQQMATGFELDEDDKISVHYVGLNDGKVIASARIRNTAPSEVKIERIAVAADLRGQGVGKAFIEFILTQLQKHRPSRVWVSSQENCREFFEKCGFSESTEAGGETQYVDMNLDYSIQ